MNRVFAIFIIGLISIAACRRSPQSSTMLTPPTALSTAFEPIGVINMFAEDYRRPSDGAIVRFGCQDRASSAKVLAMVRNGASSAQLTDVTDADGTKIGERVVWDSRADTEAEIRWNERARLFYIQAPLLRDAVTFEKSNVWRRAHCWDFRSL
jgi:hypothetical protein